MRDGDGGASVGGVGYGGVERVLHDLLRLGVEGGGGLVQQQDRRVPHEDARDRHPLLLPAGELRALGARARLVTLEVNSIALMKSQQTFQQTFQQSF